MEIRNDDEKKEEVFLRDYQKKAVRQMKDGCILNGCVGSGKSRTGLYYYFSQYGGRKEPDYIPMKNPPDLYIITTAKREIMVNGTVNLLLFYCQFIRMPIIIPIKLS